MTSYPAPPPSYNAGNGAKHYHSTDEARSPLLGGSPRAGPSAGGYYDQPDGDIPDDFKVRILRLCRSVAAILMIVHLVRCERLRKLVGDPQCVC